MSDDSLLASLERAVASAPGDVALRLHYAGLLSAAGRRDEAVQQAAVVLQSDPANAVALAVISGGSTSGEQPPTTDAPAGPVNDAEVLRQLDNELSDLAPPMFTDSEPGEKDALFEVERSGLTLADVGGMQDVKKRIEASVLAPIRNPELGRLYKKSLRGGLLLYGPPGCGKTFLARALAGELGAAFLPISLADVLDMYIGQSERNVHELFEYARRNVPCVIFFDEVDAIGQKRSQRVNAATRGSINQLLTEMDGVAADNAGVFILGATNHPWDVDVALRRPGRFDRMLLVLPPDEQARAAILRYHLRDRPIANVDTAKAAKMTEGFSGADLAYVCEVAAETAMIDSVTTNSVRMIEMRDITAAIAEIRPSTGPWFETARNVAQFSNDDGTYDELAKYLRKRRLI